MTSTPLNPDLLFVAFVPLASSELLPLIRGEHGERGKEFREGNIRFTPADFKDRSTSALLGDARQWNPGGQASAVRTIELLRAVRREHRCSHREAMAIIGST